MPNEAPNFGNRTIAAQALGLVELMGMAVVRRSV
jgi:hypothetical protein